MALKKLCNRYGCKTLVNIGQRYCDKHAMAEKRVYNRASFRERGYTTQWDKVRALKVKDSPLCEECLKHDHVKPVEIVHHIIAVDLLRQVGRDDLITDMNNLKSDCRLCHGKEDDDIWYKFAKADNMQGEAKEIIDRFERWRDRYGTNRSI